MFPLLAASSGQPLPHVRGFPALGVLWASVRPRRLSASLAFRLDRGLPGEESPAPPGRPKFFNVSLHASPALEWTPADPVRHTWDVSRYARKVLASVVVNRVAVCDTSLFFEAVSSFRESGLPSGLRDSLCTLQRRRSGHGPVLGRCNTRDGWRVRPFPVGTFTGLETPSLSWRKNAGSSAARRRVPRPLHAFVGRSVKRVSNFCFASARLRGRNGQLVFVSL